MTRMIFFIVLLAMLICGSSSSSTFQVTPNQVINEATHHIYIDANHEVQFTRLLVTNKHTEPVSTFTHVIPSNVASKIAYVKAANQSDSSLTVREFSIDPTTNPQHLTEHRYYTVSLDTPVKAGQDYEIIVTSGFHTTLTPFPASIHQGGIQRMLYNGHTNYFSMYPVLIYQTAIHTQSNSIDSFTPRRGAEKVDKTITYQKIISLAPKPYDRGEELTVHAQNHAKFANFQTAQRHFDLSTTGDVIANEQYFVVHNGAKLSGPFHRSLYDRSQHPSQGKSGPEIDAFAMVLPKTVHDMDFRDFNGNISTSRIRHLEDSVILDLHLRFPLFGGWKSDFEVGYQYHEADISNAAVDANGYITFTIPFGFPFNQACGDMLELSVLLPEGASDISWTTPFDLASVTTKTILSYKDVTGRTQVTFKAFNVVPNMWDAVTVTYLQPKATLFKGTPLIVYFLVAAILAIAFLNFANIGLGSYPVDETIVSAVSKIVNTEDQTQQPTSTKQQASTSADTTSTIVPTATVASVQEEQSGAKSRAKKSMTKKQ